MAIAATWTIRNRRLSSGAICTRASTGYKRALVVTNGGAVVYVALGRVRRRPSVGWSGSVGRVADPGAVPRAAAAILSALTGAGTSTMCIGFGTNVSYV